MPQIAFIESVFADLAAYKRSISLSQIPKLEKELRQQKVAVRHGKPVDIVL